VQALGKKISVVLRGSDLIFSCGYGGGAWLGKVLLVAASDASLLLWGRTAAEPTSVAGAGEGARVAGARAPSPLA
jgi:hypothetical protein